MPAPSLNELVTPVTATEALEQLLIIEQVLGVPVTAWQKLGIGRTVYATMAQEFADNSSIINFIAQGGFASYASQMVDPNGVPVTTWMDLVASEVYGISRIGAQYAALDNTQFIVTNPDAQAYGPFDPGSQTYGNGTTGATYHNTDTVTYASGNATGVAIVADQIGSAGTSAPTDINQMITPQGNATCSNNTTATGFDAETNQALFLRCIAKLGSLSPNGAALAYYFVATSVLDPTQTFYNASLTKPITRLKTITGAGTVDVYIANDDGAPSTGDTAIVDAAIQAWCVPLGVTAITHKATNLVFNVTYAAYVPAAAGVSGPQVQAAVSTALTNLFRALPIGGLVETTPNEVPVETIRGTIFAAIIGLVPAYAARVSVVLSVPSSDTAVATTEVPTLGAVTPTVILT